MCTSVRWHVRLLINLRIIDEIKEGKYKRYQLHESDPNYIVILLRNYYPSIWDKWSIRLAEMFLSLSSRSEIE